ncbi:hypothetical protein V1525DRAFT_213799 [Lipomyces kononenkoae]|uniref:Uncharacterized protein n=1 Tax=Lipomyces kononenkoae TaxID=34357 RepID=A0ACC3SY46_LIPKO
MPFACSPLMARATHYEALNLHPTATTAEIKARFYALSKKYHPDRLVSCPEAERHHARQRFQAVSEAYSILANPRKRAEYDLTIRGSASEAHNPYYRTPGENRQRYSGLNRTQMRAKAGDSTGHYSFFGRKMPRSSYPTNPYNTGLGGGYATGLNDDVPHFDYEKHMRQQLAYESFREERDRQKAAAKQAPIYGSIFSSVNLDPDAYRARSESFQTHTSTGTRTHGTHQHRPPPPHPHDEAHSSHSQSSQTTTRSRTSATDSDQHTFRPTTARFTRATQSQSHVSSSSPTQTHTSTTKSSIRNTHVPPRVHTHPQQQRHTYARSALSSSSSEFHTPSNISSGKIVGVLGFITASMYLTLLATGVL